MKITAINKWIINTILFMSRSVALVLVMLLTTPWAKAATPPYMNSMPSVSRVMSEVHGTNKLDTAARQCGVFGQLLQIMHVFEGPRQFSRNKLTLDEIRLSGEYRAAQNRIINSVQPALEAQKTSESGMGTPWAKWLNERYKYSSDTEYVLNTFFSSDFINRYRAIAGEEKQALSVAQAAENAPIQSRPENQLTWKSAQTQTMAFLFLVVLVICVLAVRVKVNKKATKLRIGFSSFALSKITGRVGGYRSHTEISGGQVYTSASSVSSSPVKSTHHETIRLTQYDGKQADAQLGDFDFSPQDGDIVTIWVANDISIAALNHTTRQGVCKFSAVYSNMGCLTTLKYLVLVPFVVILAIGSFFLAAQYDYLPISLLTLGTGFLPAFTFLSFFIYIFPRKSARSMSQLWSASSADAGAM